MKTRISTLVVALFMCSIAHGQNLEDFNLKKSTFDLGLEMYGYTFEIPATKTGISGDTILISN